MEVTFLYRYDISSVVFPDIERCIWSSQNYNVITNNRLRSEVLNSNTELAHNINTYVDKGELIPVDLWVPLYTSLIDHTKHNVFFNLANSLEKFTKIEVPLKSVDIHVNAVIHQKISNVDELVKLAVERYPKLYKGIEANEKRRMLAHESQISAICEYAKANYRIEINDFFQKEIKIPNANPAQA